MRTLGFRAVLLVVLSSAMAVQGARAQGATIPAPSPHGHRLAFGSTREGKSQIYVMNLETGSVRRVTHDSASDRHPAWSPDGMRLAYQSDLGGGSSVWVTDLSGASPRRVTPVGTFAMHPAWSPDGRWLAVAAGSFPDLDLWLYPADGVGSPQHITTGPAADYWPAWSPDGSRLAFVQAVLLEGHRGLDTTQSGIAIVSREGQRRRLVLADTNGVHETPSYSPDGAWIAFQTKRGKEFHLFKMRSDGTAATALRIGTVIGEVPAWGAHPLRIYFQSRDPDDSTFAIVAVDPNGRHPVRIVER